MIIQRQNKPWQGEKNMTHCFMHPPKACQQAIGDKRLIVSLTTFPARINKVHIPIKRILRNSVQPNMVVLYLARPQFSNELDDVSEELRRLLKKDTRFQIRFLDGDIRSFKKLVPALSDFPDDYIMTIDDDVYYRKHLIAKLLKRAAKYPGSIIAGRVRYAKLDRQGNFKTYKEWRLNTIFANWYKLGSRPRHRNLMTGVGGVLYPPKSLHEDVLREDLFRKLVPTADDIWFWAMAARAGTKVAVAAPYWFTFGIRGTQKTALWRTNRSHARGAEPVNDVALRNIIAQYPEVMEIVRKDR